MLHGDLAQVDGKGEEETFHHSRSSNDDESRPRPRRGLHVRQSLVLLAKVAFPQGMD